MGKTKADEWNTFICLTCEERPEFPEADKLKEHLTTVHNITEFQGNRQMTMHLDGEDFFQTNYEWDIQGVKLAQAIRCKRRGLDKKIWSQQ